MTILRKLLLEASEEELSGFRNKLFRDIKDTQNQYNIFVIDHEQINKIIGELFLTREMFRMMQQKKIPSMKPVLHNKHSATDYHRIKQFKKSDGSPFSKIENVSLAVEFQIPKDKEFVADNTLVSASFWVKGVKGRPEIFSYENALLSNDREQNILIIKAVIKRLADDVTKKLTK